MITAQLKRQPAPSPVLHYAAPLPCPSLRRQRNAENWSWWKSECNWWPPCSSTASHRQLELCGYSIPTGRHLVVCLLFDLLQDHTSYFSTEFQKASWEIHKNGLNHLTQSSPGHIYWILLFSLGRNLLRARARGRDGYDNEPLRPFSPWGYRRLPGALGAGIKPKWRCYCGKATVLGIYC